MQKIFVNDEIFQSDGDYVIGGFSTDKIDDFNLSDIKSNLKERLQRLVQEYLNSAVAWNSTLGIENPTEQAKMDLALLLKDNLDIELPYLQSDIAVQNILDHPKTESWVLGIRQNFADYEYKTSGKYKGVYNQAVTMDTESEQYKNAEYFTTAPTLEMLIEQLSIIEL